MLVHALIAYLLVGFVLDAACSLCPRQKITYVQPKSLGVHTIGLLGQMHNREPNKREAVSLRAFLRVVRTPVNTTRLFGYGWIDHTDVKSTGGFAPYHRGFQDTVPPLTLKYLDHGAWQSGVPIEMRWGTNPPPSKDTTNFAFRLDAVLPTDKAELFRLEVYGWLRAAEFSLSDCRVKNNALTPWQKMQGVANIVTPGSGQSAVPSTDLLGADRRLRNLTSPNTAASRQTTLSPPAQSPVVVVLFVNHWSDDAGMAIFQAQQVLRHIEYHITQARVQRMLVYIRQTLYYSQVFPEYMARHMDPRATPYVTFVVWSSELEYTHEVWDHQFVGYHAATALSGFTNVMISYLDIDEYLAWPGSARSLHEALSMCNTTQLNAMGLVSMYTICEDCTTLYQTDAYADRALWTGRESTAGTETRVALLQWQAKNSSQALVEKAIGYNSSQCRWYKEDPLLQYTRTFDDALLEAVIKRPWSERTNPEMWSWHGKMIFRVQATKVFNPHRAEMMPGHEREYAYLDPETCPYIVHLLNMFKYRDFDGSRGLVKYYQKNWRNKWWILSPQGRQQTAV